ncbi:MAG: hypothetical protein ACRC46_00460 [Thermoguttaceae bacterium]
MSVNVAAGCGERIIDVACDVGDFFAVTVRRGVRGVATLVGRDTAVARRLFVVVIATVAFGGFTARGLDAVNATTVLLRAAGFGAQLFLVERDFDVVAADVRDLQTAADFIKDSLAACGETNLSPFK